MSEHADSSDLLFGTPHAEEALANKLADDLRVSGAATALLTISKVQPSDVGKYSVLVSNQEGSVTSDAAVLAVGQPPTIIGPPQDKTTAEGAIATFGVKATGTAPLSY